MVGRELTENDAVTHNVDIPFEVFFHGGSYPGDVRIDFPEMFFVFM